MTSAFRRRASAALRGVGSMLLMLLAAAAFAGAAQAHEVRPGYLEIREIGPAEYDILWKTPAQNNMRLSLDVELPADCESLSPPRTVLTDGAVFARWRERCASPLPGRTVGIAGLDRTLTDALIRFEPLDGSARTLRVTADAPRAILPERPTLRGVAAAYTRLGFEHILLGIDHLLFVLALLVLVRDIRRLALAITAFTAAHSLTLAGSALGYLYLPAPPVEAVIALSIVFLAAEILAARDGRPGLISRRPWLASFAFGLLHGFGFAGALREIGLPQEATLAALAFFNLGVEAGQLVFVAAAGAVWLLLRRLPKVSGVPVTAAAWPIGVVAGYWTVERIVGVLGL